MFPLATSKLFANKNPGVIRYVFQLSTATFTKCAHGDSINLKCTSHRPRVLVQPFCGKVRNCNVTTSLYTTQVRRERDKRTLGREPIGLSQISRDMVRAIYIHSN